MKKCPIFLIIFFISLFLWAQDDPDFFNDDGSFPELIGDEELQAPAKKKFRFKNRMLELSVANINVDISNDFIASRDILQNPFYMLRNIKSIKQDPTRIYRDPAVINIDDFFNGFAFNLRAAIKPLSLNFNWKDNWGLGLDIGHIDAWGNITIPDTVLSFKEATNEPFGAGGAVFADVGIPVFFHVNDIKIKLRPAVYVPVIYARPGMAYSHKNDYQNPETGAEGLYLEVNYDMRIYSLVDMQQDVRQSLADEAWNIPRNNLGYDFGLNIEYPWRSWLDIGVDFVNIPVIMAKLNHYTQFNGSIVIDTSYLDMNGLVNGEISEHVYFFDYDGQTYGYNADGQKIHRPFTTLFYANYRPRDSYILSFIPSLGFSINYLYPRIGAVEGGLSARIDLANTFITTLGINYNNRTWKNSIDFILNFRAFELDFGLSSQSSDLKKSWQGAGIGVNFGMKFGW